MEGAALSLDPVPLGSVPPTVSYLGKVAITCILYKTSREGTFTDRKWVRSIRPGVAAGLEQSGPRATFCGDGDVWNSAELVAALLSLLQSLNSALRMGELYGSILYLNKAVLKMPPVLNRLWGQNKQASSLNPNLSLMEKKQKLELVLI